MRLKWGRSRFNTLLSVIHDNENYNFISQINLGMIAVHSKVIKADSVLKREKFFFYFNMQPFISPNGYGSNNSNQKNNKKSNPYIFRKNFQIKNH